LVSMMFLSWFHEIGQVIVTGESSYRGTGNWRGVEFFYAPILEWFGMPVFLLLYAFGWLISRWGTQVPNRACPWVVPRGEFADDGKEGARVPNRATPWVVWGTAGATLGALGGMAAVMVVMIAGANGGDGLRGAVSAFVVGAIVGGVLRGKGRSLPATVGGALGGAVGGMCAASWGEINPRETGLDLDSVFAFILLGVLPAVVTAGFVGAVVGELRELFSANRVNPEDRQVH
jgi:hypothetical protein